MFSFIFSHLNDILQVYKIKRTTSKQAYDGLTFMTSTTASDVRDADLTVEYSCCLFICLFACMLVSSFVCFLYFIHQ